MTLRAAVPILPTHDIDATVHFYRLLAFDLTYHQTRPNPYVVLHRDLVDLHFAGITDFTPEDSYGSCIVPVDDTTEIFDEFAASLRAEYGKLPQSGFPRVTRPRKRKNTGDNPGFSVIDPSGNWIRFFGAPVATEPIEEPPNALRRALDNAIVLGDSKGDVAQAIRILDSKIRVAAPASALIDAVTYRIELAERMDDDETAHSLERRLLSLRQEISKP